MKRLIIALTILFSLALPAVAQAQAHAAPCQFILGLKPCRPWTPSTNWWPGGKN
ncbi:MAG: hypothetical protein ACYDAG_12625 [Chloroflexota bacterium]